MKYAILDIETTGISYKNGKITEIAILIHDGKEFSKHQIKNVIIAGIETHVCVLQTTIDLLKQGYQPVIIEDCVGSRSLNDKALAIERMRQEGAIISTYESILFSLYR
jgi:nicotinamidase-related amidase